MNTEDITLLDWDKPIKLKYSGMELRILCRDLRVGIDQTAYLLAASRMISMSEILITAKPDGTVIEGAPTLGPIVNK